MKAVKTRFFGNTMIHSFTCRNFYSFGDEATVSFVVNQNAPDDNGYFFAPSGTRLSKALTVIGPNASGKTNLMKVLPFLKWLVVDSFETKPGELLPTRPFAFGGNEKKPTDVSVVFEIEGRVYTYGFSLTRDRIVSEELKVREFVKERKSSARLFSRVWNEESESYDFSGSREYRFPKKFEEMFRTNASLVSTAARLNHKGSLDITAFWRLVENNVVEEGWTGDISAPDRRPGQLSEALKFYSENEPLKKEAEKLLAYLDLGLLGFSVENAGSFPVEAYAVHSINGEKHSLNLRYESSGTKQLLLLLADILSALKNGGVAVIDEIDTSLHPEIVTALLDLFFQPETNPLNAQILVSTHSHLVLNHLDKYQVVLVEKDGRGASDTWRLDEVEGIRNDENLRGRYIAGAYGAIPNF